MTKPIEEFNSQGKYCKDCHRKRNREWSANNREKNLQSKRKWNKKSWSLSAKNGKYNRKKERQLGMAQGTAAHKLRKSLMWHLAVKCRMDVCYRCGHPITSAEDMSIDHKVDWLDSDDPVGRFFDVDNIQFSHKKCNVRRSIPA
jgi:hypothetical protein